jgi:hypothetical protein
LLKMHLRNTVPHPKAPLAADLSAASRSYHNELSVIPLTESSIARPAVDAFTSGPYVPSVELSLCRAVETLVQQPFPHLGIIQGGCLDCGMVHILQDAQPHIAFETLEAFIKDDGVG